MNRLTPNYNWIELFRPFPLVHLSNTDYTRRWGDLLLPLASDTIAEVPPGVNQKCPQILSLHNHPSCWIDCGAKRGCCITASAPRTPTPDWATKFILFHGKRHPQEIGTAEIAAYLTHLAVERKLTASTAESGLRGDPVFVSAGVGN